MVLFLAAVSDPFLVFQPLLLVADRNLIPF